MTTLIAEDLLLVLLDDEKGTTSGAVPVGTVLGGALLVELSLTERVHVEKGDGIWARAKVHAEGVTPPEDPFLAEALATVAEKPRPAVDLVDKLGKNVKDRLADRLVEAGILERRDKKVLGVFSSKRWPSADEGAYEDDVRARLSRALVQGMEPDERTAALVALLWAIDQAHKVVPHEGVSSKDVRKRAKQLAEGDWAAKAVKDAVAAAMAATTAATTAAVAASTTATINS